MALTKLTAVLNKISTLATTIKGQATDIKVSFDHDVNVVKDYVNDTLINEIEALFATKDELAGITLGQTPDNSLTNSKLAPEIKIGSLYTTTNISNSYSISPTPAISAYSDGLTLKIKINADSTGNTTLNVNLLGARNILKANGTSVTNLKANGVYTVVHSSGNFILQGEGATGNAIASELLSGKTATTDAGEITGAMVNNGAVNITPSGANQAIAEGYHNGLGVVSGVVAGKKFASGMDASSIAQSSFTLTDGTTGQRYTLTKSGLGFKPSRIIAKQYSAPTLTYEIQLLYEEIAGGFYPKTMKLTSFVNGTGSASTWNVKGDISPAYVVDGGFCIPLVYQNTNTYWEAYE